MATNAPVFSTIPTQDDHSNRLQTNIQDAFNRILSKINSVGGLQVNGALNLNSTSQPYTPANGSYALVTVTTAGTVTIGGVSFSATLGQTLYVGPGITLICGSATLSGPVFVNN